ncbi:hypothetical protein BV22DRAFT_1052595, partial [Leucogyrophana mollusca]
MKRPHWQERAPQEPKGGDRKKRKLLQWVVIYLVPTLTPVDAKFRNRRTFAIYLEDTATSRNHSSMSAGLVGRDHVAQIQDTGTSGRTLISVGVQTDGGSHDRLPHPGLRSDPKIMNQQNID